MFSLDMASYESIFREYIKSSTLDHDLEQVTGYEKMNEYFEVFSEKWIAYIMKRPREFFIDDGHLNERFFHLEDTIKAFFIALLKKAAFKNPNKNTDLSPWPIFRIYDKNIKMINTFVDIAYRLHDNPDFTSESIFQCKDLMYTSLNIATFMVLAALPQTGFDQGDNAFMKLSVDFNQTPLMYAFDNIYKFKKPVIKILCKRGGFSAGEWASGKVMLTFCILDNELATVLATNFRSDLMHYINQPLNMSQWTCTPLHFCCKSHAAQGLFQLVRLLISLGADSKRKDNYGNTAWDVIEERKNRRAHVNDEVETQNFKAVQDLFTSRHIAKHVVR